MSGEIKISIIVPIYNAENYLVKCLDSILNQSYKNLEIILVNDGSTDFSRRIIDEYAMKDNRIIVIHKENEGIGSAYRVATEKMTGDYVSFVDSDDYIDLSTYENLIEIVEDKCPDIIHFCMDFTNEKGEKFQLFNSSDQTIIGYENILNYHFKFFKFPSLVCRLFKRQLLYNITFFDQNIGIDEMAIIQILPKCNKAVYITKTFYYVYAREESVSRIKYSKQKIRDGIKIQQFMCKYYDHYYKNFAQYLYIKYINYLTMAYDIARADHEIRKSNEMSLIKNDLNLYYQKAKNTIEFKNASWEFKLRVEAFTLSPYLYSFFSSLLLISKKLIKRIVPVSILRMGYRKKKDSI